AVSMSPVAWPGTVRSRPSPPRGRGRARRSGRTTPCGRPIGDGKGKQSSWSFTRGGPLPIAAQWHAQYTVGNLLSVTYYWYINDVNPDDPYRCRDGGATSQAVSRRAAAPAAGRVLDAGPRRGHGRADLGAPGRGRRRDQAGGLRPLRHA